MRNDEGKDKNKFLVSMRGLTPEESFQVVEFLNKFIPEFELKEYRIREKKGKFGWWGRV